jgi:hypothetical protein
MQIYVFLNKSYLIKCKMSTDFQVIEGIALDKRQWLRSVNLGAKELFNDWHAEKNNESYQHHFEQLLTLEQFRFYFPHRSLLMRAGWKRK